MNLRRLMFSFITINNVGFKDEGKKRNKVINLEDERVGNNFGVKGLILFDS